jgi:membrane-associated protease RseP (regulator of RpoE activity)
MPCYAESMSQSSVPDDQSRLPEAEPTVLRWPGTERSPGAQLDATVPPSADRSAGAPPYRQLTAADLERPRRRVFLPAFLFAATCLSTFFAGALNWNPALYLERSQADAVIGVNWFQGLIYMASVIGILLAHEMGHFLQTVRYGVPASLPFFIPVPILMTGTMGAVIGIEGSKADRKQLFDIGVSGPLAGLAVALPIIWFGIKAATVMPATGDALGGSPIAQLGDPLIFKLLATWLRPGDLPAGELLNKNNPLLMAGWVGMLITGLNMLPISQLDGGHVIYGLFGRKAHLVARGFLIAAILFIIFGEQYNWVVMLVLVILLGVDHPPTRDDNVRLGPVRRIVGLASLSIPVLCFTPVLL